MTSHIARRLSSLALALSAAGLASLSLTSAHAAPTTNSRATATETRPSQDTSSALVQLAGDPISTSAKTKPPKGKKIDDYQLDKQGRLRLDGEKVSTSIELRPLAQPESLSELWVLTLPQALK